MNHFLIKGMTLAILALLLCFNKVIATDISASKSVCNVYGVRLTLGSYYTFKGEKNSYSEKLIISFNSKSKCQNFEIKIQKIGSRAGTVGIKVDQRPIESFAFYDFKVYFHNLFVYNLEQGASYSYTIIPYDSAARGPYQFKLPQKTIDKNWKGMRIGLYGDMDANFGAPTISLLNKLSATNSNIEVDFKIFLGDMAYDLCSNQYTNSQSYLRKIETYSPYNIQMKTFGNHQACQNFAFQYANQAFPAPGSSLLNNRFYSFNVGPVHFINLDIRDPWYNQRNTASITDYLYILFKDDLDKISQHRDEFPFIVVYGHYPFECSIRRDYCTQDIFNRIKAFEELMFDYNVDLYFCGHIHGYERTYPLNNHVNFINRTTDTVNYFQNPKAPIYIVSGIGGNVEGTYESEDPINKTLSVASSLEKSVSILTVYNQTHLKMEQVSSQDQHIIDYFYISQVLNSNSTYSDLTDIYVDEWKQYELYTDLISLGLIIFTTLGLIIYLVKQNQRNSQAKAINQNSSELISLVDKVEN